MILAFKKDKYCHSTFSLWDFLSGVKGIKRGSKKKEPSPNVLKSLKQLDDGSIFTFSFPQRENSLPFQRDSEALGRYPPFLPEQDDRNEGN